MTANLLTLNSSKIEFLLIGLKQQLCKIQDCSLTTSDISVTETITETEIIDPALTETETETMLIYETEII